MTGVIVGVQYWDLWNIASISEVPYSIEELSLMSRSELTDIVLDYLED